MKRSLLFAILCALSILSSKAQQVTVTINHHSPTEVAMAAADGFSSVDEWYTHLNRTVVLAAALDTLNRAWAALSADQQRSLREAETKWERWYNALPYATPRDIARRIEVLKQHNRELDAWLPENLRHGPPEYNSPAQPAQRIPTHPPTPQEMGMQPKIQ
jgi:hypothetical protein